MSSLDLTYDLPSSWEWTTFGNLLSIQGGSQPPKSTFIYEPRDRYIRLLQIQDFGKRPHPTYIPVELARKTCERDDVLIARYGASLGRILTGMAGAYNVAMAKVVFDHSILDSRFVFFLLQTELFQTPIHMISRSAQNGFNKGDIYPLQIPLAPLNEQKRIVDEIETQFARLDQVVASLEAVQRKLKQYRASLLKAACEGRLVPQDPNDEPAGALLQRILAERRRKWEDAEWQKLIVKAQQKAAQAQRKAAGRPARLRDIPDAEWQAVPAAAYQPYLPKNDKWKKKYQEPEGVDSAELPDLPNGWLWVRSEQICDPISNGTTPRGRNKSTSKDGIPFVRVSDLSFDGRLNVSDELHFLEHTADIKNSFSRATVVPGDVLINIVGLPFGQTSVVPSDYEEWLINQNITVFHPISTEVHSQYLAYNFLAPSVTSRDLVSRATATAGQYYINLTTCRSTMIPLPPYSQQERIVNELERNLSIVRAVQDAITANLKRAARLRQAILKKAFSGQLVPQNPDDESAATLLQRIEESQ